MEVDGERRCRSERAQNDLRWRSDGFYDFHNILTLKNRRLSHQLSSSFVVRDITLRFAIPVLRYSRKQRCDKSEPDVHMHVQYAENKRSYNKSE